MCDTDSYSGWLCPASSPSLARQSETVMGAGEVCDTDSYSGWLCPASSPSLARQSETAMGAGEVCDTDSYSGWLCPASSPSLARQSEMAVGAGEVCDTGESVSERWCGRLETSYYGNIASGWAETWKESMIALGGYNWGETATREADRHL